MRKPVGRAIMMLVMGCTVNMGGQALAADELKAVIVVRLEDSAGISAASRSAAQAEVNRIFARAGVQITWVTSHQPPANQAAFRPGIEVRVSLLSGSLSAQRIHAESLSDSVFGRADRGTG